MIIDIATTSSCNYGCRYCSEGLCSEETMRSRLPNSKSKVTPEALRLLVNEVRLDNPKEPITIGFWGGEPMMNWELCKAIMHEFMDDPAVTFLFYTNGYFVERYLEELKAVNEKVGPQRLLMQISYDGRAINDAVRLTKTGKPTSDTCIKAFRLLRDNGFSVKYKSTLPVEHCDKMFDSFVDLVEQGEGYFPTPDVAHWYDPSKIDQYMADLTTSLLKIAQYIYEHDLPANTFKWFTTSRAKCAAGCNYVALDVDGMVVPCHSAMYDGEDHRWGNILDPDIWLKCKSKFRLYEDLRVELGTSDKCSECKALYCMTCPAHTYDMLKGSYRERWTGINPNMCLVFKIADGVHRALLAALAKKHTAQS